MRIFCLGLTDLFIIINLIIIILKVGLLLLLTVLPSNEFILYGIESSWRHHADGI